MKVNELLLTIIFVGGFAAILAYFAHKQKQSTWEGQLIKKRHSYDDESGQTSYKLIFKTAEGKKKRVQIRSKAEYERWIEGDRAVKKAGVYFPEKV